MTDKSASEPSQQGFRRRVIGLLALGFLALLAAGIATAWVQGRNQESANWVEHTLDTQARINALLSAMERMETGRRGLLLNGNRDFDARLQEAATDARQSLSAIESLVADNPEQGARVVELGRILTDYRASAERARRLPDQAARSAFGAALDRDPGVFLIRRARVLGEAMLDDERQLLLRRQADQARTLGIYYAVFGATGLLLVLVAGTTLAVMLRYTRELSESRAELRLLNTDLEAMVAARTAELQRANAEIQRFAYIVSHDLRSPLVNVMGFTSELDAARKTIAAFLDKADAEHPELADAPAREAATVDLPEAIGFIRASTQKMDRLINAILRLSREGRRTLAPERVDAEALARDVVASMQHRLDETGAEIAVEPLPEIVTDRLAFEQIVSNLLENAVKYLQPGRPGFVRVSGRVERDRLIYEVSDNGRGIDPRDHERIFDLFRRSGAQDQPGEGIGLAHVRALAYRLGGLIEVRSELDRGATFRLSLPRVLKGGETRDD